VYIGGTETPKTGLPVAATFAYAEESERGKNTLEDRFWGLDA
jgi:hypothetical protein